MLREERIAEIIHQIHDERRLRTTALMAKYDVTEGTIRRDLNELQRRGILKKVHGGAIAALTDPVEMSGRLITATKNKQRLAKKAQTLIRPGQLLLIDGGSTNLALVKEFDRNMALKVYTNSLPIATHLITFPNVEIHFLGGRILKHSEVSLDILTFQQLDRIKADLCFLGVRSVHPDIGIATLSADEALLKKRMMEVSANTAILVTNEKIFTSDHHVIAAATDVDSMVLEKNADASFVNQIRKSGIDIII